MSDVLTSVFVAAEMNDAEVAALLDGSGKGRAPIYPQYLRDALTHCNGKAVPLTAEWKVINPEAVKRESVVSGMKQAAKKLELSHRFRILPNPDADRITIIVKPEPAFIGPLPEPATETDK